MAQEFLASARPSKGALVIGLEGDLGGGKTTFVQGFAKGLGIKEKILSPTFVILRRFRIPKKFQVSRFPPATLERSDGGRGRFHEFYHIDCYRIEKPQELLDLGFKEIVSDPKNILIIEWAEKVKKILPKDTITLKFEFINEKTRKIVLK